MEWYFHCSSNVFTAKKGFVLSKKFSHAKTTYTYEVYFIRIWSKSEIKSYMTNASLVERILSSPSMTLALIKVLPLEHGEKLWMQWAILPMIMLHYLKEGIFVHVCLVNHFSPLKAKWFLWWEVSRWGESQVNSKHEKKEKKKQSSRNEHEGATEKGPENSF
jgi:hypothetical protein